MSFAVAAAAPDIYIIAHKNSCEERKRGNSNSVLIGGRE
jgi:hypothetical protein